MTAKSVEEPHVTFFEWCIERVLLPSGISNAEYQYHVIFLKRITRSPYFMRTDCEQYIRPLLKSNSYFVFVGYRFWNGTDADLFNLLVDTTLQERGQELTEDERLGDFYPFLEKCAEISPELLFFHPKFHTCMPEK